MLDAPRRKVKRGKAQGSNTPGIRPNEPVRDNPRFVGLPKKVRRDARGAGNSARSAGRHHESAHAGEERSGVISERVRELGGDITLSRDLFLNLGVKFRQTRPMDARTIVMRRVITEVPSRDVVDAVDDVVARDEVRIGALASVMDVRRVHGAEKRNQHRQNENEDARKRTKPGQTRHERDDEERRKEQYALMRRVFMTHFPSPRIRLQRVPDGVLEPTHRAAVIIGPSRFILGLIEIIHVMTKRMVQNPSVARDAGLQRVHLFEQSIEQCRLERRDVLMVVIEGANAAFREYADERPRNQRYDVIDKCVHQDVAEEDQGKTENRKPILAISKDAHECLTEKRSIFDRNV
jgi:hypothetical protein